MTSEILKSDNYSELHFNQGIQILFMEKKTVFFIFATIVVRGTPYPSLIKQ